jgi:hypothetical protein
MDDGESVGRSEDKADAPPGDDGTSAPLPETVRISSITQAPLARFEIPRCLGFSRVIVSRNRAVRCAIERFVLRSAEIWHGRGVSRGWGWGCLVYEYRTLGCA